MKNGKKPEKLLYRLMKIANVERDDIVMDFFLGSGTSAAVASKIGCKWIGVETSKDIFEIAKTRLENILIGDPSGISALSNERLTGYRCINLESYEDTLNNLHLHKPASSRDLFGNLPQAAQDDYLMRYMLDVESRGSLLSVQDFKNPFDYELNIAVDSAGAYEPRKVDMVETFNYLIGLRVKSIDAQQERGFVSVIGTLPSGESCLVLWRDCDRIDYDELRRMANRLDLEAANNPFEVIYINGDHNIPASYTPSAGEDASGWSHKIRQIEPEFLERMFSMEDV